MAPRLYVIDGHAQIYAAHFAPMDGALTAPDGEPTKATLIFTTMVLKLLREKQPDLIAVAMDAPGPTFRHKMYEAYKANRPPMPEELPVQIARIEDILAALRIPVLRIPGYEADDVIGTLATQATERGLDTVICSKDKDLEQLLDENVSMYDPRSDKALDVAGLAAAKGITPAQVPDVLALEGDTSDNIPGVPDVGPKTALQWIQKYGSLAELLAHQDEIKGKRGENLRAHTDQLALSRQLATIDTTAPLNIDFSALQVRPPDQAALAALFERLGFKRLLTQLDAPAAASSQTAAPEPPAPQRDYVLVQTEAQLAEFIAALEKQQIFALDTETTGLNPVAADLVGLSFSWCSGQGYYLPVRGPMGSRHLAAEQILPLLRPILANPAIAKVGQNIKFDQVVLASAGAPLAGVAFDTMVASYVLDSGRTQHNLDSLAADFLGVETIPIEALIGKGKNQLTFDMVDLETAAEYAAEDADITWRLYRHFDKYLHDTSLRTLFTEVEMPLVEVLAAMEYAGVALDVTFLNKLSTQWGQRLAELLEAIHQQAGEIFNVDSPKQLGRVLFEKLGLNSTKKTKGGASGVKSQSTDMEVLETLRWEHAVPGLVLEYRKLAKLKNTYVDKLPAMICPATGRVHASFNQTVTATGRLSSSNPNMQNIPIRSDEGQEIRRAFVPGAADRVIMAADYSQIELRFMAHLSGDKALAQAFNAGQDIHRFVAAEVFGVAPDAVTSAQRAKAKAVNFGIIYGQTGYGLSRTIGVDVDEAQAFIDAYFARYADVRRFIDATIEAARRDGCVTTILGRRRVLPDIKARNANRRRLAERMAVNTVVQGSAADMIKKAMISLHRRIRDDALPLTMLMQVHDELVFELPADQAPACADIVRREMAAALPLSVPVTVDIGWGDNWLECK